MKIGILGAGSIARTMAGTLKQMENVSCYAVAARDYERASVFAQIYGFEKAYGSYEEMAADPEVELIYIATPHSFHFEHAKLCIEHGKHVLCEKPMTINKAQAEQLFSLAEEKQVFLMEALWTRFMPSRKLIDELIQEGAIGKPALISADLGYPIMDKERIKEPALAGGALLDIGIYPIHFVLMAFGSGIEKITSTAVLSDKGVDLQNSMTLTYKDGKVAVLHSTVMAATNRQGMIAGDKGYIIVENINNCEGICVYNAEHQLVKRIEVPQQITGYEYEVAAAVKAIKEGRRSCSEMPPELTCQVMGMMDELRKEWGVIYPQERA